MANAGQLVSSLVVGLGALAAEEYLRSALLAFLAVELEIEASVVLALEVDRSIGRANIDDAVG